MAKAFLADALYSLKEAKEALNDGIYHRAIRRAQESVELALKAILRLFGIEYPKKHEISDVLNYLSQKRKLPAWFTSELDKICEISKRLASERGPAFYGDERAFVPPKTLYNKDDAEKAINDCEYVVTLCSRVFEYWGST